LSYGPVRSVSRQLRRSQRGFWNSSHRFWNSSHRPSPWVWVRLFILYHTSRLGRNRPFAWPRSPRRDPAPARLVDPSAEWHTSAGRWEMWRMRGGSWHRYLHSSSAKRGDEVWYPPKSAPRPCSNGATLRDRPASRRYRRAACRLSQASAHHDAGPAHPHNRRCHGRPRSLESARVE
jgi:hypothetical protein